MVLGPIDPVFWLGCSLFLVAISLTVLLAALLPAVRELTRAARSAEKLFDTLQREFPPTLEAIRLTGLEISELTDDINAGVNNAADAAKQVDRSLTDARQQVQKVQRGTRSMVAGVRAAWQTLQRAPRRRRSLEALPTTTESRDYNRHRESDYADADYAIESIELDPLPPEQQTAALESELLAERDRPSRERSDAREFRPE